MGDWTGVGGRRVLLTGATNGIGLAAARALAADGARLAIVARSESRGAEAAAAIAAGAPDADRVDVLVADLARQSDVRALAEEALGRYPRLDVLVNNAGAVFSRRELTPEGHERTWAVNHLAPFLLTNLLLERLRESAPARVVTTASDAHKGATIPFADFAGERDYGRTGFHRYGETKLANILFTAELARRLEGTGVTATCFHPGVVATGFNHNNGAVARVAMTVMRPFLRRPERGADTLVWLVETPEVVDGAYYVDRQVATPSAAARDDEAARRLWEASLAQVGLAGAAA